MTRPVFFITLLVTFAVAGGVAPAGSVALSWSEVDHPGLTGYRVLLRDQGVWQYEFVDVGFATSHELTDLADCHDYQVALGSRDQIGWIRGGPSEWIDVWARPTVSAVAPSTLPAGELVELTVSGTNFRAGMEATFADPSITVRAVHVVDCHEARLEVESSVATLPGPKPLRVVNPDRSFAEASGPVVEGAADPSGLVAHWSMDAFTAAGHIADLAGGGHSGFIYGVSWTEGVSGQALNFSQGNGFMLVDGSAGFADASRFTVSAWIRPSGTGNQPESLIDLREGWGGWGLDLRPSEARLELRGFGSEAVASSAFLERDEWQHVAVAHDAGIVRTYRNGELWDELEVPRAPFGTSADLFIGNASDLSRVFRGAIDEVRYYARPLGAEEIAQIAAEDSGAWCSDADGDGFPSPGHPACGGGLADCDDGDAGIRPRQSEICDDGIDQDCDGVDEPCLACPDGECTVDPAGLVAHWTVDDLTVQGDIHDVTGSGHDGFVYGISVGPGFIGSGLDFDGDNDVMSVLYSPDFEDLEAVTLTAWVRVHEDAEGPVATLFHHTEDTGPTGGFRLAVQPEESRLRLYGMTNPGERHSSAFLQAGEWVHVAVTYADGTLTFYADGEIEDVVHGAHPPLSTFADLYIGNSPELRDDFHGSLDEFRFYRRGLASWEIATIHAEDVARHCQQAQDAHCTD